MTGGQRQSGTPVVLCMCCHSLRALALLLVLLELTQMSLQLPESGFLTQTSLWTFSARLHQAGRPVLQSCYILGCLAMSPFYY